MQVADLGDDPFHDVTDRLEVHFCDLSMRDGLRERRVVPIPGAGRQPYSRVV